MLRLSRRLQAAADWVPEGCRFADIGTDHGFLPVWLVQSGRIDHAIAADLRSGPLARAGETARTAGLTEQIQLRLCPGLEGIRPDEANCLAICGMGGEVIRGILEAAAWTKQGVTLILQPQSHPDRLRLWLQQSGYCIQEERCLQEEGKWYPLLLVTGGRDTPLTPAEALLGRQERWHPVDPWGGYLRHHMERLSRQWEGLMTADEPDEARMEAISTLLEELDTWAGEYPEEDETW